MADVASSAPRLRRITLPPGTEGQPEVVTEFKDWPQPLGAPGHLEHVEVALTGAVTRVTEASVMEVDHQRELVYLNVYWHNLRPDPEAA